MRRRNHQIIIRLNDAEREQLRRQLKRTCLSQEAYIRMLISCKQPKETPPIDYYDTLRELHAVGNNLNQIAARANSLGVIDAAYYLREAGALRTAIRKLQSAVELPESF